MEKNNNEYDYLNYSNLSEIKNIINDEILLFSDKILKINRFGFNQERIIIITNCGIYNIKKKELKRKIPLNVILGITISKTSEEFIIHGNDNEYDYHYNSPKRFEIIRIINNSFFELNHKKLKFFESKEKSLKNFVTSKKEKKLNPNFTRMPKDNLIDIDQYFNRTTTINSVSEINDILNSIIIDDNISNENINNEKEINNNKDENIMTKSDEIVIEDFNIIKIIGHGECGIVCLVEYKKNNEIYAMKSLKKEVLIEHNQIKNELIEKEILQKLKYPFLCELLFCFQNIDHIYFIMPFLNGGELFQHLKKFQKFDEEKVRFYGAQIALALDFLHKNDIIYHDLKPENILMDENGYLKLINFGMASKIKSNEINKCLTGTPEYLAPEIITGEGIYKSSDWWSFGVLLYEMLCGLPPFYEENIEKMYEMIKNETFKFPNDYNLSDDAKDIITKLLNKNPNERLGNKNEIEEIKNHPFFSIIDFELIEKKKIPAPFIPNINDNKDVKYFEEDYINEDIEKSNIPENKMDLINNNQDKFKDFDN